MPYLISEHSIDCIFFVLGGHHTLQHWLKNVEWGGGSENPHEKVHLTFKTQGHFFKTFLTAKAFFLN